MPVNRPQRNNQHSRPHMRQSVGTLENLPLAWINAALAIMIVIGIQYVYFRRTPPDVNRTPPSVLLPAMLALTASSAYGVVCLNGVLSARAQVPLLS